MNEQMVNVFDFTIQLPSGIWQLPGGVIVRPRLVCYGIGRKRDPYALPKTKRYEEVQKWTHEEALRLFRNNRAAFIERGQALVIQAVRTEYGGKKNRWLRDDLEAYGMEALFECIATLDKGDTVEDIPNWLYTAVVNRCKDYYNYECREALGGEGKDGQQVNRVPTDSKRAQRALTRHADPFCETMRLDCEYDREGDYVWIATRGDPLDMEILRLLEEGYTQTEIAVKLNMPQKTVNNRVLTMRKRLEDKGISPEM